MYTVPVFVINGAVWDEIFRPKRRRFVPLSASPSGLSLCCSASLLRLRCLYRLRSPRVARSVRLSLLPLVGSCFVDFVRLHCFASAPSVDCVRRAVTRSVRFVDSPRWVAVLWPFLLCLFGQFFSAFFRLCVENIALFYCLSWIFRFWYLPMVLLIEPMFELPCLL